ncbi:sensor domain-containing protein [Cryobacterium arcticum]|uniref:Uncharacterized protein n=1 Tax=Cryobacterium arcticum TaxID=670052 RepID=A0A317ZSY2_9MICO|nr:EAL domain-containing protein [Cryobacterium arcticum]PXA68229.1 hypothetical protein CTB96_16530 [Cryobacterium arcticum]
MAVGSTIDNDPAADDSATELAPRIIDPDADIRWPHGASAGLADQVPPVEAGTGVVIRALDGTVIGANPAAARLLHTSWPALIQSTLDDARWQPIDEHGLPVALDRRPSAETLATNRPIETRLIGLALPGSSGEADALAWLSASTAVAVDAAGTTIAGIVMFTDVTDTARGRAATDRVLASYRDLAGNVTDFVLRTTLDGTIEWVSPSVTAATGWPMTTLIGHGPGGFEHPDDTAKSRALLQGIQTGQRTQGRCRLLCADGGYRWFFLSSSPLFAPNGTITGGVHGFTSIDALVQAEDAADAERALLRASLDSLADPYVVVASQPGEHGMAADFIVTEANPAACEFLRIPREQLLGESLFAPWPVAIAEHLAALCAQVVASALPQRLDGVHSTASGRDRWYDVRVSPLGRGASVHLRDVTSQHLAQRAEHESHQRYRLLAENASDVVVMVDQDDRLVWVSPSAEELLGWRPDELVLRTPMELVHPDDLSELMTTRDDFVDGLLLLAPFRLRRKDGQYRWVSASIREVRDADTTLVARVVSVRDVHEETLARQALEASEKMFRAVLTSSSTGMILCDPIGRIQVVNAALCRILQRDEAWLLTRSTDDLVHPDDLPGLQDARRRTLEPGGTPPIIEMRLIRADGTVIWARRSASVIRDAAGAPTRLVVQLEDVTAEHDAREELRFQAFNDRLTGMPNRAWILNALESDISDAHRTQGAVGVLFIDLDNFKLINDSLGHVAGDEVLTEIAERMMAAMRPQDRVGRFGGDEFVVVVPHVTSPDEVERVAATIAATLGTELTIHGHRIVPTVSIGIALSTPESTAASLLRDTDSALFRAKKSGRARWQFFDATMHSQAMTRLTLEDEIRTSLAAGDFVVHYQPVVTLADRAVVGHEALVRWQHPQRGLVSPAEFLPVAEESGLILGIGRAVLAQVCTVLAGHPDAPGTISVNVSAVELARDDWAQLFTATVERHGVDPARLVVEVTETAVLALGTVTVANLVAVRDLGVGLHVDDFGTGFSSISLLRDLPVTGLKLDASFVADLGDPLSEDGRGAHALAAGLAGLVSHLGLAGVAEGVETEAQAEALRGQGWSHGQGYLFGRPAPWPA